jgi:hypothetical protein
MLSCCIYIHKHVRWIWSFSFFVSSSMVIRPLSLFRILKTNILSQLSFFSVKLEIWLSYRDTRYSPGTRFYCIWSSSSLLSRFCHSYFFAFTLFHRRHSFSKFNYKPFTIIQDTQRTRLNRFWSSYKNDLRQAFFCMMSVLGIKERKKKEVFF